jgi:hypothetical protein
MASLNPHDDSVNVDGAPEIVCIDSSKDDDTSL